MITLEVPVNVTKLAPEVQKIRVQCNLNSEAIVPATPGAVPSVTALDEVPVVGGQSGIHAARRVHICRRFTQGTHREERTVRVFPGWCHP